MQQLSDEELRAKAAHELIAAEVAADEPLWKHKTQAWQDLGEKTMRLYKESLKLAKKGLPLTPAHKEARYLRNSWYRKKKSGKKSGKKTGKAVPVVAVVEAPVLEVVEVEAPVETVSLVITASCSEQINVSIQYAIARPTPAPRTRPVVTVQCAIVRPIPALREIKPTDYHEGIEVLKWREEDQDAKTFTEEKRKSMQLAAKSMTKEEAFAYAKKEGYRVITQKSAGCRFYFKGGNKSKDTKFNYTAQRIDADIKRQLDKKNNNEAYRKKFRKMRVWVLE
jgi:hypothetical protein